MAPRRAYDTPAWRRTAAAVRAARGGICASCGARGARHVDHIVPRKAGGSDGPENLQLLCGRCHSRKTSLRDGGFGRARRFDRPCGVPGCAVDGTPADPGHWWNR